MENQLKIASGGTRFGHWVVDFMCYHIFVVLTIILASHYLSSVSMETYNEREFMEFGARSFGLWFLGRILYYMVSEGMFGTTIGKIIAGTEIVTPKGEKPKTRKLIKRTFARFIPFDAFSFFSSSGIGWHDYVSGTRVVLKETQNI